MAADFMTTNPQALLKAFDESLFQDEKPGKITTWEKLSNGHYSHKAEIWAGRAFFKAKVETHRLTFNIVRPWDDGVSTVVYGYYHGHLIETFLNHFDRMFTSGSATALATFDDDCAPPK